MRDVVIASAVRTPIGSFGGSLKGTAARTLGAIAIKEAVKRAGKMCIRDRWSSSHDIFVTGTGTIPS